MAVWGLPAARHHHHLHRGGGAKQCGVQQQQQQQHQKEKTTARVAAAFATATTDGCKRVQQWQRADGARDQAANPSFPTPLLSSCVGAIFLVLVLLFVGLPLVHPLHAATLIIVRIAVVGGGIASGWRARAAGRVRMLWEW